MYIKGAVSDRSRSGCESVDSEVLSDRFVVPLLLVAVDESRALPIAPAVQLVTNFLGDRNVCRCRKAWCPQESARAHEFGVWLVREFHFIGSVDAVLTGDAVASGASGGGSHGNSRAGGV